MPSTIANGLAFTTATRQREMIQFKIDDDMFHFTPPKVAGMVVSVVDTSGVPELDALRGMMDWLGNGLPDDESEYLQERLRDEDDDLDLPQLFEIFQALVVEVGGRPTPAPSAS